MVKENVMDWKVKRFILLNLYIQYKYKTEYEELLKIVFTDILCLNPNEVSVNVNTYYKY